MTLNTNTNSHYSDHFHGKVNTLHMVYGFFDRYFDKEDIKEIGREALSYLKKQDMDEPVTTESEALLRFESYIEKYLTIHGFRNKEFQMKLAMAKVKDKKNVVPFFDMLYIYGVTPTGFISSGVSDAVTRLVS